MAILPSSLDLVPASHPAAPWQQELRQAVRDIDELCQVLDLDPAELTLGRAALASFPLLAPRGYIRRMRPGDPLDPLLRQVLPLADEDVSNPDFVADPVGDAAAEVMPGLLRKYQGRALLVTTGACAVHCRYCFRRSFPYDELPAARTAWDAAITHIEADDTLHEVIFSGGDPLTITDGRLADLTARLAGIPHLRRLRLHTRLPIMIPSRVNDDLLAWLVGGRLTPIVVIHANHPREFDAEVESAIARLVDAGIPVLNQAVLLRGVNDSLEVQAELCERLIDQRVLPYYLHQLDRVAGAAHFEVSTVAGQRLIAALRERLPGYAVPAFVREVAGAAYKIVVG